MRKMYKTQKGITLVALVITIIVLIILAAVSINAVMNDGLINNAKEAAGKYENAQKEEKTELGKLMQEIENEKGSWVQAADGTITNKNDSTKTFTVGEKVALTAEGVPDIEWRVLRVNENNRLELISTEATELSLTLPDDFTDSSKTENTINEKLTMALNFNSNSSKLQAAREEELQILCDKFSDELFEESHVVYASDGFGKAEYDGIIEETGEHSWLIDCVYTFTDDLGLSYECFGWTDQTRFY